MTLQDHSPMLDQPDADAPRPVFQLPETQALADRLRIRRAMTEEARQTDAVDLYNIRRAAMVAAHTEELRRLDDAERARQSRWNFNARSLGLQPHASVVASDVAAAIAKTRADAPDSNTPFDAWSPEDLAAFGARPEKTTLAQGVSDHMKPARAAFGLRRKSRLRVWGVRAAAGLAAVFAASLMVQGMGQGQAETGVAVQQAGHSEAYERLRAMPFPK